MNTARRPSRRFVIGMILLFIPVFALLFFVTTMQRTRHLLSLRTRCGDTLVIRSTDISYFGTPYRTRIEAYNAMTRRWGGAWWLDNEAQALSVIRGGRELLFLNEKSDLIADRDGVARNLGHLPMSSRDPLYVDGGFLFEHRNGGLWRFDFDAETTTRVRFEQPIAAQAGDSIRFWGWTIHNSRFLLIRLTRSRGRSVAICEVKGDRLMPLGEQRSSRREGLIGVLKNRGWYLVRSFVPEESRRVVDAETGQDVAVLSDRGTHAWRVVGERIYGLDRPDAIGYRDVVDRVRQFDPATGEVIGEAVRFDPVSSRDCEFGAEGKYLFALDDFGVLQTVDIDEANVTRTQIQQGQAWWWPLRIVGLTAAVLWWLVWSIGKRRGQRSFQPVIDLAILHSVLSLCFGVRLYAYMNGPNWDGSLYQWESVLFLGTASSAIGLVMLWVVHGPQRLGFRLGAIAFALTVLAGFAVVVWDADPMKFDASMERTKTMLGTAASGAALLSVLWVLKAFGLRLCHRHDDAMPSDADRGFSILHMIGWTVAFALLFVVLRWRNFELPEWETAGVLSASGAASGLATGVLLWLGLGRSKLRYLVVPVGLALTGLVYRLTERYDVMQVGTALVPLVLVSMFVFRWNGYYLARPTVIEPVESHLER